MNETCTSLISCSWLSKKQKAVLEGELRSIFMKLPESSVPAKCVALKCLSVVQCKPGLVIVANAPYSGGDGAVPTGITFDTKNGIRTRTLSRFAKQWGMKKDEVPDFEAAARRFNILMLNASLTYPPRPFLWKGFLTPLLEFVKKINPDARFVFMGSKAKLIAQNIGPGFTKKCFRHPAVASKDEMTMVTKIIVDYINDSSLCKINNLHGGCNVPAKAKQR